MIEKTETEIKKELTDYFESKGYRVFRMNAGKVRHNVVMNKANTLDLLVQTMYHDIWVEVKRPGMGPTEGQAEEIDRLQSWGRNVVVIHSIEEAMEAGL